MSLQYNVNNDGLPSVNPTSYDPTATPAVSIVPSTQTIELTNAGLVSVSATPSLQVSGIVNGTRVTLFQEGAGSTVLTDDGTLAGSKLKLGAATRTLAQYQMLVLVYDGNFWCEENYSAAGGGGVTNVTASAPIASTGGATPNISHNTSGVVAAAYTYASVTVDATGHVTTASSGTAPVTSVGASAPITSTGGTTPTIGMAASGVVAGAYTNANITVDTYGRITVAANGTPPGLVYWTEAQTAFGGKTIDSFTAKAAGADADAVLAAKGSGATAAQIADGTAAGGDNRGLYATDWQKSRTASDRVASGDYSTVSGGYTNQAQSPYSTVSGGAGNRITTTTPSDYAFIGGGSGNLATATYAVMVGGTNNGNAASYGFVGSGQNNSASGDYGTIVGGQSNTTGASSTHAFIGGGRSNSVTVVGAYSAVGGGYSNSVSGGGVSSAFIGGGETNILTAIDGSTYANHSVIGGGYNNIIRNRYNGILGGYQNSIYAASHSGIGGGQANSVYGGVQSNIDGGYGNFIEGSQATIGGGQENSITKIAWYAANNNYSTIGGGYNNNINGGTASVIPGGRHATTRNSMGRFVFASGSPDADPVAHRGATQTTIIVPFIDTSDASVVPLTANGGAVSLGSANEDWNILRLASYSVMKLRAEVTARNKNTAIAGDVRGWTIEALAYMDAAAGSATITSVTSSTFGAGLVGATATLAVDTTYGAVYIEVKGLAATGIRWAGTIYATEVVTF